MIDITSPPPTQSAFSRPLVVHAPPEGIDPPDHYAELQRRLAALEERAEDLRDLRRRAETDPYAMGDDLRAASMGLLKDEADFRQELSALYRTYQSACVRRMEQAVREQDEMGGVILRGLQMLGWEPVDIDPKYQFKRWGDLTSTIETNPRYQRAGRTRLHWHEERLGWGEMAAQESSFAQQANREFRRRLEKARATLEA